MLLAVFGMVVAPGVVATQAKDDFIGFNDISVDGVDRDGDGRYRSFSLDVVVDTAHPDAGKEKNFYLEANIWYGGQSGTHDERVSVSLLPTGEGERVTVPISSHVDSYGTLTIELQIHAKDIFDVLPRDTETITVEYEHPSNDLEGTTTETTTTTPSDETTGTRLLEVSRANVGEDGYEGGSVTYSVTDADIGGRVLDDSVLRSVPAGSTVRLVAEPVEGYTFDRWESDEGEQWREREITIRMDESRDVTAYFANSTESNQTPSGLAVTAESAAVDSRTVNVSYNVTNPTDEPVPGVELRLTETPENWTLVSHADADGSWADRQRAWAWQAIESNTSRTVSVQFQAAPNESVAGASLTANLSAYQHPTQTVTTTVGNDSRTAETGLAAELRLPDSVAANETMNATYTVTNVGETPSTGVILSLERVPDGWTIESQSSTDGIWAADDRAWIWQAIGENETKAATVTFRVQTNASSGEQTLVANVSTADGQVRTVTGTTTVTNSTRESP
jgi:hypothetical protein